MLSLGLKAVRAPERITLLSSLHLVAVNKVHLRGFWRQLAFRLQFMLDLCIQKKPLMGEINVPSASAAWPCPWHGSGRADGGQRTGPGRFKPISCCRKCILCGTDAGGGGGHVSLVILIVPSCLSHHLWRYVRAVDISPESRRGLFWARMKRRRHF